MGEDVEDHLGAIEDLEVGEGGDRLRLRRGEVLEEDQGGGAAMEGGGDHLHQLAGTEDRPRVRATPVLDQRVEGFEAAGATQGRELRHRRLALRLRREAAQQQRPLPAGHRNRPVAARETRLHLLHHGGEIEDQVVEARRLQPPRRCRLLRLRIEVGEVRPVGEAVGGEGEGGDQIEAQES